MSAKKTVTTTGQTEGQYLHVDEIAKLIGDIDISDLELVRMDSYSDSEIYNKVRKTGMEKELLCASIQTAIVGMGNKRYGSVSVSGKIVDIEDLYVKCDVKVKLNLGANLEPGDLTGRRLQRFFRKQISDYIKKTGTASYLWRKYSSHNEKFKHVVFPGAEHLVDKEDEIAYLYGTYLELDSRLNTHIAERIERVLNARGFIVNRVPIAAL
jgi:hypothetical protein